MTLIVATVMLQSQINAFKTSSLVKIDFIVSFYKQHNQTLRKELTEHSLSMLITITAVCCVCERTARWSSG